MLGEYWWVLLSYDSLCGSVWWCVFFFFFKQKTAYEIRLSLVGSEMCIRDSTCLDAVNNGVTAVGIIDGREKHSILFEIFSDKGSGTLICLLYTSDAADE